MDTRDLVVSWISEYIRLTLQRHRLSSALALLLAHTLHLHLESEPVTSSAVLDLVFGLSDKIASYLLD